VCLSERVCYSVYVRKVSTELFGSILCHVLVVSTKWDEIRIHSTYAALLLISVIAVCLSKQAHVDLLNLFLIPQSSETGSKSLRGGAWLGEEAEEPSLI